MAISDAYATASEYLAVVSKSDSESNAQITNDLLVMSRVIEHELDRFFNQDAAPVAVIYDAAQVSWDPDRVGYNRALMVDDFVSVASIVWDTDRNNTFTASLVPTDWMLRPTNAALQPEPHPYTEIYLPMWTYAPLPYWPVGIQVKVTGIRGWPAVPSAIKRACIELTALLRQESSRGDEQAGDVPVSLTKEQMGIIERLKAPYSKSGGVVVA